MDWALIVGSWPCWRSSSVLLKKMMLCNSLWISATTLLTVYRDWEGVKTLVRKLSRVGILEVIPLVRYIFRALAFEMSVSSRAFGSFLPSEDWSSLVSFEGEVPCELCMEISRLASFEALRLVFPETPASTSFASMLISLEASRSTTPLETSRVSSFEDWSFFPFEGFFFGLCMQLGGRLKWAALSSSVSSLPPPLSSPLTF